MSDEPSRITVSRDALRADLAEMELRLRVYFDEQLRHKADNGTFMELALKVDALDRGDFTPVHRRALEELVEEKLAGNAATAWSGKQKVMAAVSFGTALVWTSLSFILVIGKVI